MKQGNGDVAKASLPADFSKDQLARAQTVIYFQLPKGGSVLAPKRATCRIFTTFGFLLYNCSHQYCEQCQRERSEMCLVDQHSLKQRFVHSHKTESGENGKTGTREH